MLFYYLIDEANSKLLLKIKNVNKYWYKFQRFLIYWNNKFNNLNYKMLQNKELVKHFTPIKHSANEICDLANTILVS